MDKGGGIGYSGSTTCDSPYVCTVVNSYYSQCLPSGSGSPTTSNAPPTSSSPSGGSSSGSGLNAKFKAKGKVFFGTCSDQGRFSNSQDSQVTIANFGGLTPENSMKWDAVCYLWLSLFLLDD
jgi:endo-1,4-beta-xylanase